MKYSKLLILIFSISALSSCKKLDTMLNNPNSVDPSQANVDLLLNQVQLAVPGFFNGVSDFGAQLTRQQQFFGPLYNNGFQPTDFDGTWTSAYTGVLKNAYVMIPLALEQKKYKQAGIAQILQAYTLGTLVDNFGDIPYSEALLGKDNFNPKADQGAELYNTVFALLDSGIANIGKATQVAGPLNDLYFNKDYTKWVTLANTLKLKFYMQTRLVDNSVSTKIADLLTENDLINDPEQDFVFKYGTQDNTPDSRHPHYGIDYNNTDPASNDVQLYVGDYFMWAIGIEKDGTGAVTNTDPRRRFYFYRQRTNYADANEESAPCNYEPRPGHYSDEMPFCLVGAGYWGRDHGDASGTPPDGLLRTVWGVYPAGGQFDNSQATSISKGIGGKGAGIDPIWLSSFTYFLQAEAAVALGLTTNGDAKSLLEKGVRASIAKVIGFPATIAVDVPENRVPTEAVIDNYVGVVLANYDAATTEAEKLDVIMKEYYLASWGNGVEAYNNYRRTGSPNNMQPIKTTPTPGFFIRSLTYPSVYVNRNTNAPEQKTPGAAANKVFWDNNPDNFIK